MTLQPDFVPTFDRSWQRAWQALGCTPAPDLLVRLLTAYAEPHRQYHTTQHLHECFTRLEPALPLCERPGEVEISLWFHDAVYELKGGDNELRSAQWAERELAQAGVGMDVAQRVRDLIMSTQHSALPQTVDACVLVDVDLSILGADPDRFSEYEAQVRKEYDWVPGWIFRRKRKEILREFLSRPFLYSTDHFRQLLEKQARANLVGAIDRL